MTLLLITIPGFIACSALIIYSGARLSKYSDIITSLTGVGKAWFGLIFMATVTSLPELFTGVSSILFFNVPNIAIGDIMGSCAFNLLILAFLDYFVPKKPLSSMVTKNHVLAAFFSIFLMTNVVISIIFENYIPGLPGVSGVSLFNVLVYLIAMRLIFKNENRLKETAVTETIPPIVLKNSGMTLKVAIYRYLFFALLVIVGAIFLPYFASGIAAGTGISKTFIGTLLVAATTSLPELTVSISSVRMGSIDTAMGNLLGSNIFNIVILSIDDFLYTKGPLLAETSHEHALSGLVTLLMTSVVGISILYSARTKRFVLAIDAIILMVLYTILMIAIFRIS